MASNKRSKYARRTSVSIRRSEKIPIIVGVAIFVVAVFVFSVIVGNILLDKAESYTPEDERYTRSPEGILIPTHDVPAVNAYVYKFGSDATSYTDEGIVDLSLCLRYEDGSIAYNSEIGGQMGIDSVTSGVDLGENIAYLHECQAKVCAYLFLDFLSDENTLNGRMTRAYELSLIEEAVVAGVDDILLMGLDVNESNVGEVVDFLEEIKKFSGDVHVGVALDCVAVMKAEEDVYLAGRLSAVCDYIALDLRAEALPELRLPEDSSSDADEQESESAPENFSEESSDATVGADAFSLLLDEMHYYIVGFDMRLVFDSDSIENYEKAGEMGYGNRQIVD